MALTRGPLIDHPLRPSRTESAVTIKDEHSTGLVHTLSVPAGVRPISWAICNPMHWRKVRHQRSPQSSVNVAGSCRDTRGAPCPRQSLRRRFVTRRSTEVARSHQAWLAELSSRSTSESSNGVDDRRLCTVAVRRLCRTFVSSVLLDKNVPMTPDSRVSTTEPLAICVLLWANPGHDDDLVAYEGQVLRLLADHDGEVLQRVRTGYEPGQPFEVQILRFSSEGSMQRFIDDDRRTALAGMRERAIERTDVLKVTIV